MADATARGLVVIDADTRKAQAAFAAMNKQIGAAKSAFDLASGSGSGFAGAIGKIGSVLASSGGGISGMASAIGALGGILGKVVPIVGVVVIAFEAYQRIVKDLIPWVNKLIERQEYLGGLFDSPNFTFLAEQGQLYRDRVEADKEYARQGARRRAGLSFVQVKGVTTGMDLGEPDADIVFGEDEGIDIHRSRGRGRGRGRPDSPGGVLRPGRTPEEYAADAEARADRAREAREGRAMARAGVTPEKAAAEKARADKDKLEKANEEIAEGLKKYEDAFSVFSSGISAAIDAAISGEESIGKAALKGAASALRSIAMQAPAKALWEVAQGWAKLGNPVTAPTAAAHFASAKFFAAAGLAAGVAAAGIGAALGGGGGGGSSATAGGGHVRGGGGGRGDGGETINIVINGFSGDRKELGQEIHKQLRAAKGSGRTRDDDDRSVKFLGG